MLGLAWCSYGRLVCLGGVRMVPILRVCPSVGRSAQGASDGNVSGIRGTEHRARILWLRRRTRDVSASKSRDCVVRAEAAFSFNEDGRSPECVWPGVCNA